MRSSAKTIVLAGLLWSALLGSAQNQRPALEAVSIKPVRTNRFVPVAVALKASALLRLSHMRSNGHTKSTIISYREAPPGSAVNITRSK
jgi:hypothetical protein